MKRSPASGSYS